MLEDLELDVEVWIDDLGDSSRAAFGDLPSWAVMISSGGTILRKLAWPEPESLQQFVKGLPTAEQMHASPPERVRAKRCEYSLKRAAALRSGTERERAAERRARVHERRAHLAYLVEAAPEHASRDAWLRELSGDGPAYQRAWALTRQAALPPRRQR